MCTVLTSERSSNHFDAFYTDFVMLSCRQRPVGVVVSAKFKREHGKQFCCVLCDDVHVDTLSALCSHYYETHKLTAADVASLGFRAPRYCSSLLCCVVASKQTDLCYCRRSVAESTDLRRARCARTSPNSLDTSDAITNSTWRGVRFLLAVFAMASSWE